MPGITREQTNRLIEDLGYEDEPHYSSQAMALIRKAGEE